MDNINKTHDNSNYTTNLSHDVPYSPILMSFSLLTMSALVGELLHQTVDDRVCLDAEPHPKRVSATLTGRHIRMLLATNLSWVDAHRSMAYLSNVDG